MSARDRNRRATDSYSAIDALRLRDAGPTLEDNLVNIVGYVLLVSICVLGMMVW